MAPQILKKLTPSSPKNLILFSKHHTKQYIIKNQYPPHPHLLFPLPHLTHPTHVTHLLKALHIIFHPPPLKQLPTSQDNPFQPLQTNIIPPHHLIQ
ncbi:polysaccharide biosynthesis protein, partial [Bacillus altitudinis]|uniref:polysaccharide biosynthesis protein n=1 Tax=Bacillus altitudinis TaxID=293387 RepID=UPI003B51C784